MATKKEMKDKLFLLLTCCLVFHVMSYAQEIHVSGDSCAGITKGKELPQLEFSLPVIEEAINTTVLRDLKYHSVNPDSVIIEIGINKVEDTFFLEVSAPNKRKWEAPDLTRIDMFVGYVILPHCLAYILNFNSGFDPIPRFFYESPKKGTLYLESGSPVKWLDGSMEWGFRFIDDEQLLLYRRDFF